MFFFSFSEWSLRNHLVAKCYSSRKEKDRQSLVFLKHLSNSVIGVRCDLALGKKKKNSSYIPIERTLLENDGDSLCLEAANDRTNGRREEVEQHYDRRH